MSNQLRVLFVDDEPHVLQGLRRNLDHMGDVWDTKFAESGAEALDILDQAAAPFDAVVADMRMPGMDGVALLEEVRNRHPQVARIILSGYPDKELVLRTVGITHQYLSKPCDLELLKAILTRTCDLRDLLGTDKLKALVSQMRSLPSLPAMYYQLVTELQSPDTSVKRVGTIISEDIGMTARVLQLVNSAFFGLPRRVAHPVQAVVLLGLNTIKALVLSAYVFSQFASTKLGGLSLNSLREHSLTVGIVAGQIAEVERLEPYLIDCALTAGILHDVGKLVLAANLPEQYNLVLKFAIDQEMYLPEAERKIFGASHAEVGAYLMGLWGLSDHIVEALAYHHYPSKSLEKEFSPLTAVYVANNLAHELHPDGPGELNLPVEVDYLANLGLTERLPIWRSIYQEVIGRRNEGES